MEERSKGDTRGWNFERLCHFYLIGQKGQSLSKHIFFKLVVFVYLISIFMSIHLNYIGHIAASVVYTIFHISVCYLLLLYTMLPEIESELRSNVILAYILCSLESITDKFLVNDCCKSAGVPLLL